MEDARPKYDVTLDDGKVRVTIQVEETGEPSIAHVVEVIDVCKSGIIGIIGKGMAL